MTLEELAVQDAVTVDEAAALFVESGLSSLNEWSGLGTRGRARLVLARRTARTMAAVEQLAAQGQDLAAARAYASVDGGRAWARMAAEAAGRGVSESLARQRAGSIDLSTPRSLGASMFGGPCFDPNAPGTVHIDVGSGVPPVGSGAP